MLTELVLAQALTLAFVTARVAGFVVTSPFPGDQVPSQVRVALVVALSFCGALAVAPTGAPPPLDLGLVISVAGDFLVGAAIGFSFRLVMMAADVLGAVLSQAIGLGTPSILNPTSGVNDTTIGTFITVFATLVALGVGAHRVVLSYLLESLRAVPPGSARALSASAPLFAELAGRSITMGVQLAMPVLALSIVIQVALALLARAAPSLQIFSVGLSILVAGGLLALGTSLHGIGTGLIGHFGAMPAFLDQLLLGLSGR